MKKYMLLLLAIIATSCQVENTSKNTSEAPYIYTVSGKIVIDILGVALTHEHVMSTFGAPVSDQAYYDRDSLFRQVIPYLKELKSLGVQTIFDCTAAYFGRAPQLLREIADSTGLNLVTNTGIYGAANDRYVPNFVSTATADKIAERWTEEFENGIDDTGIKPGFIKLGFDDGLPSETDLKLFRAGAITHKNTGLTIAVHTSNNPEAIAAQLAILEELGVDPSAWVWVHANKCDQENVLLETAAKGGWISLDGAQPNQTIAIEGDTLSVIDYHLKLLEAFKSKDLLHRVLLSHDGNSYPRGGAIRPYDAVFKELIPKMKTAGFSQEEIDQLTIENPQEAFAIRTRLAKRM